MFRRFLSVLLVWWLLWLAIQTIILVVAGHPLWLSVSDATLSVILLGIGSYAIVNVLRYYRPGDRQLGYLLVWSGVIAFIGTGITVWILGILLKSNVEYISSLNGSFLLRLSFGFLATVFVAALSWVWFFLQRQKEDEQRQAAAHELAREAELTKLRQQLQPHFLFNSLNSLSALIEADQASAKRMVQQLSDFFRGTLRKNESQKVTLDEEVTQTKLYLEIEMVRFGHRLKTDILMDESSKKKRLPSLVLQPVVENAIKFGLYDTTGEVKITISCATDGPDLLVAVSNPFDPQTASARSGSGFGLSSIRRRLYLLYNRGDLLTTTQEGTLYTTTLRIPQ